MLNKDKRSLLLSMILGDGCLHYIRNHGRLYGGITIDHGIEQADYVAWKANILSSIFERDVKVRPGHKGKSVQVSVCAKRLRSWRKFCYPNGKKDLTKVLRFITHPEFAVALWLMDDGYVEPSFSKLASGEKKLYGARFRIFTCHETLDNHDKLVEWFKLHFNVVPSIKYQKDNRNNRSYPFLKFNQADSLVIWEKLREVILQIKSMRHKFRHIETTYNNRFLQRTPEHSSDDIVGSLRK